MNDGIIKQDGTSRLVKASFPATYEEFREMAANGTLAMDVLFNAVGWQQLPTFLNKANLLQDDTAALHRLATTATLNDMFAKLSMPLGYYGFDVTVRFSDGLPAVNVLLNGLTDVFGNTAETDKNGCCSRTMCASKTATVTISNHIGIADTSIEITAQDGIAFTPITITLERDTSVHLFQTSQTLRVLTGVPVDMCIVGGGASGFSSWNARGGFPGGGGGYVTNILNVVLEDKNVTLVVGSGGAKGYEVYGAGGTTSIVYNGTTATASGATNNTGNGSCTSAGNSTNGTVRVFNDDSLPLPGGAGGYGRTGDSSISRYPGGADFGGAGGLGTGNYNYAEGLDGTGPGGGGGGGATFNYSYAAGPAGNGAAGGLYIRVKAPEVTV